ncbi:MAG TPA: ABC transporter substrate-binding protein [Candidatus Bathyarchaeia archaeon]|nr:ABC transporter substrate-binding protein [Candidatus Bathyarchaeia archaeon]
MNQGIGPLTRTAFLAFTICVLMLSGIVFTIPIIPAHATKLNPNLHITLLVPTSNSARRAWAGIIQNNLQQVGFDVGKVELPFSPNIYDRALQPATSNVGMTFDQGGFDILFVGYNLGIDADPWSLYHSSQFAPAGQNYYLWNNTQNDQLSTQIIRTLDKPARLDLVKQWQVLAAKELPSIPILYTRETVAFDTKAGSNAQQVFLAYHAPSWPPIEHLSTAANSTIILAQTGQAPGEGLIPGMGTSYYDTTVYNEMFSSLALRNDTTFKSMVPELAAGTVAAPGWTHSADNKVWNVTLRQGVKWHDGQPFNATDVKFTFDSLQDPAMGAGIQAFISGIVGGKNNVTVTGQYQVTFKLPQPYAYFVENILTAGILPAHILKNVALKDWRNSQFNRPDTSSTVGGPPIGTGPYKWDHFDAGSKSVVLTRNDQYFNFPEWGNSTLRAKGQFTVKTYIVQNIVGTDAAITALNGGQVDILDSQYHLEIQPTFLSSWGAPKGGLATYDAFGVQEMGVNMNNPILGTGKDTPYAKNHPGNATAAAEAARWIRQAISYAVPRDQIVTSLLNGAGSPAITTPVVGNYRTGFAVTEGFNAALQPYPFDTNKAQQLLQQAGYTPTSGTPSFFDAYGLYLIAGVVIAIVAIAAVFLLRARRPLPGPTTTTTTTTTPP